jgi:hypothetical protein
MALGEFLKMSGGGGGLMLAEERRLVGGAFCEAKAAHQRTVRHARPEEALKHGRRRK